MKVSQNVMRVLSMCSTEGNALTLPERLDRAAYLATNQVLEAAGGKWNRKAKAHLFPGDAAEAMEQIILTGEVTIAQDFGYFPTPADVVERMQEAVLPNGWQPVRMLEPSAGRGNIVKGFSDYVARIDCVELLAENVKPLEALEGVASVTHGDFLAQEPHRSFDLVAMNPPFGKRADLVHVMHALKFLRPGGTLVSIMAAGITFREDRKSVAFRDLVEARGGIIEPLPESSFRQSGTEVNTIMVVIPAED